VPDLLNWLDGPLGLVLIVVLLLLALGWYLSYLAARLDRLHHRVESSRAALEARLARRAANALEVGRLLDALDVPGGGQLTASADHALNGLPGPHRCDVNGHSILEPPVSEAAENALTRSLHVAFDDPGTIRVLRAEPAAAGLLDELAGAGERAQLARRFHNDAVAHAQRMRRKRIVRWARLAGRARMPQMVELDDSLPADLSSPL
jgi:hypothetical protein